MRITQKFATSTIVYSSPTYNATINATGTRIDTEKHVGDGARTYATIDGTGLGARYLYNHPDHLTGANTITTGARTFEEVLDYMPFGGVRVDSKAGSWSEQRQYAGHDFDQTSGYSYMKARYYDPQVKRFLGEDKMFWSVGYDLTDPQLANSYSYARNTPITHLDPDGNEPFSLMIGAGVVLTALTSLGVQVPLWWQGTTAPTHQESQQYFQMQQAAGWMTVAALEAQAPAVVAFAGGMSARSINNATPIKEQKAMTLRQNQANGQAFESETFSKQKAAYPQTQPQITVETQSGVRTRFDMVSRMPNGDICAIECKASRAAPLTKNQSAAFPEIERSGARVVGQGKPGFPGGMSIPPTKVQVIRPNN